jgi:hypothetical protein
MDWLTAGFWFAVGFAVGYLVRCCVTLSRRRPIATVEPDILARAREAARTHRIDPDEITRAAEERLRRARGGTS